MINLDQEKTFNESPYDKISSMLDIKNGMAHCPAHDDKTRSLSISRGTDGVALLCCHAGCRTENIVDALGITMADLFPQKAKDKRETSRRTHNYPGYRKTIINFSDGTKTAFFERFENGSWLKGLNGHKQTLYNLDALKTPGIKLLSESEKDADQLNTIGFQALAFGGADNWKAEYVDLLAGHEVFILPHNDEPGRKAGDRVAHDLITKGCKVKVIPSETWGPHRGADVADWIQQFKNPDDAGERLSMLIESTPEYGTAGTIADEESGIKIVNASSYLETDPPEPDQIFEDLFDKGDKVAIIGSSKLRKSFFLLMMLLCLAAGRPFLGFKTPKPRKVLCCQFEIKDHHFHRRVKRMARALGITADDLGGRFQIINARGLGLSGPDGIDRIMKESLEVKPDIIAFDPLYKLATGVENAAEDVKVILNAFDMLAEQTGAAISYVHHDPKGSPGDRDIRDRGAGSNVLGRDYDACITLTPHAQDPDAAIVEVLLRNYPPRDPFTILWTLEENGGYCFEVRPDLLPEKKTSKTKPPQPPLSIYLPIAESILGTEEMEITPFKADFKTRSGLSDHRIRAFLSWATSGDDPYLLTKNLRSFGLNKKWVKIGRRFSDGK